MLDITIRNLYINNGSTRIVPIAVFNKSLCVFYQAYCMCNQGDIAGNNEWILLIPLSEIWISDIDLGKYIFLKTFQRDRYFTDFSRETGTGTG